MDLSSTAAIQPWQFQNVFILNLLSFQQADRCLLGQGERAYWSPLKGSEEEEHSFEITGHKEHIFTISNHPQKALVGI